MTMHAHEDAIIRAFISPARRARWLESLASPKRRVRMLDRLNHCRDIDERYATPLAAKANVVALLKSRGAPALCYVLSAGPVTLDGREMPLEEAVKEAEACGWGTIIGCLPGQLACYHDECDERRLLLERNGP
jgi:hypothetical protein